MAHPDIFVPRRRRGVELDEEQFAHYNDESVIGIVNSTLLTDPTAPEAIDAASSDVRLVAIVRNPVDRAYSWYLKRARDGDGIYARGITFDDAIEADPALIEGGLYYEAIKRYLEYFDSGRILVLDYHLLAQDAGRFIEEIYRFVGADPGFKPPELTTRSNYSSGVRSAGIHQLMRRGKATLWKVSGENGPLVSRIESSGLVRRLRRLNEQGTATMTPEARARMSGIFTEHNSAIATLLGWDLRHWT